MVDLHEEFQKSRFFHEARIDRRSVDSLIGIAAGITADGCINQKEATFLKNWIKSNLIHLDDPVVNILYRRLDDMLRDNILDPDESLELLSLLKQFTGIHEGSVQLFSTPASLPLNSPPPTLSWEDRTFILTGTMAYGPRKDCEALIIERGGRIGCSVSKKVNFLIIGSIGNDQWMHTSYGFKIKKAVELRETGFPIAIISEEHWQQTLFG